MKIVYIDENVATTISRISKLGKEACGLIIGKSCTDQGIVVKLIQTPLPNQQINAKWVGEHAKELVGMLPGGLYIVGAFILSSSLRMDSTLKGCLYEAYESISGLKMFPFMKKVMFDQSPSWLALHLNLSGNLVKCQMFDMLHKSAPTAVNWNFQSVSGGWKLLTSQMSISLPLSYNSLQDLSEDIDNNLARYYQRIMDSYVEINGSFRSGEEILGKLVAGNLLEGAGGNVDSLQVPCNLFLPQRSLIEAEKETEMLKSSGTVLLNGCMQISAHTLLSSTVEQASNALKLDALLSLNQRISLVLGDDKIEFDKDVLFLPKRIFYPDDTCMNPTFEWSDYMLSWENEEDCANRIQENLNFKIDQQKLDNDREEFFQFDPEKNVSRPSRQLMSTSKDHQTNFATKRSNFKKQKTVSISEDSPVSIPSQILLPYQQRRKSNKFDEQVFPQLVSPTLLEPSPYLQPAAPSPSPYIQPAAPSPSPYIQPAAPSPSPYLQPAAPIIYDSNNENKFDSSLLKTSSQEKIENTNEIEYKDVRGEEYAVGFEEDLISVNSNTSIDKGMMTDDYVQAEPFEWSVLLSRFFGVVFNFWRVFFLILPFTFNYGLIFFRFLFTNFSFFLTIAWNRLQDFNLKQISNTSSKKNVSSQLHKTASRCSKSKPTKSRKFRKSNSVNSCSNNKSRCRPISNSFSISDDSLSDSSLSSDSSEGFFDTPIFCDRFKNKLLNYLRLSSWLGLVVYMIRLLKKTVFFLVLIASIIASYYYVTSLGYKIERRSFRLPAALITFLRYINEYIGLKAFVIFTVCAFIIRKYFLSADIEEDEIQGAKIKDQ